MLHTKFQGNQSIGPGEDFLWFLPYMGMAALNNFSFLKAMEAVYEIWLQSAK